MNEVLRLENISIEFGRHSTEIVPGNISLLAGKMTVLELVLEPAVTQIIMGDCKILSGSGTLLGYPLVGLSSRRRRELLRKIGFISASDLLIDDMNLHDFLELPLAIAGLSRSQRSRRIRVTLAELGLTLQGSRPLNELDTSGRRLASVAQALIKSPAVIIGEIRPDDFDQGIVVPMLKKYILHGGSVLAFGVVQPIAQPAAEEEQFAPAH
ncbi:MAG: hypothetical protein WBP29_04300 [Candidatus Zixiibacteriota bacterium]